MRSVRYLSLAFEPGEAFDGELLPGVVDGAADVWPVPECYNATLDRPVAQTSEHDWFELDVLISPHLTPSEAAARLRHIAAWLDAHGEALMSHPRLKEQLAKPSMNGMPKRRPHAHLSARDQLRAAVERSNTKP